MKLVVTDNKKRIIIALLMLGISIICIIPCLNNQIPQGDDMTFHILRIESVYNAIKTGQGYPSYVYSKLLEGYGYGAGLFYPDILLLPAVLFRCIGASPELAMKLYIFLILLLTCYTSYFAGKGIGRSRYAGVITMILYVMGHYHLEDIYRRAAIGEVVAMAFIPLLFLGLYDYTEDKYRRKGLLCLTFTGLLLSHTITFVLSAIIAAVWVLIRIKKVLDKRHIMGLFVEALLCAAVTCFYWMPVLEQFADSKFYVSTNPAFLTQEEPMTLLGILCGRLSVSFAELGILVLLIAFAVEKKLCSKKAVYSLLICIFLLVIETKLFPWKLIDKTPLVSIQFPWRLNMYTEFFVAFGIAVQAKVFYENKLLINKRLILSMAFCILVGFFNLSIVWQVEILRNSNYPDGYIDEPSNTNELGFDEWLPSEGDLGQTVYSNNKHMVINGSNEYSGTYNENGSFEFVADGITGECIVPKYYYKGYEAVLIKDDGTEEQLLISKNKDNALINILISDKKGTVLVNYKGTRIQKISLFISIVSFILCFISILGLRRMK